MFLEWTHCYIFAKIFNFIFVKKNKPEQHSTRKVDEPLMETLFHKYFTSLCLFSRRYIFDNEKAKDIVQDVFLNIWEKGELYVSEAMIKGYLFTSVKNRCLNYIRDNKKFNYEVEVADLDRKTSPDNKLEYKELEKILKTEIDALPDKCKEVFLLSRFEELKYGEIAERLGISIKTVEAQISKALKILREKLSHHTDVLIMFFMKFFNKFNKGK